MAKQQRRTPSVRIAARVQRAGVELDRRERLAQMADEARRAEAAHAAKFWHGIGADAPAINGMTVTQALVSLMKQRRSLT